MNVNEIRELLQQFLYKPITDVARFRALLDQHPTWKDREIKEYRVRKSRLNQSLQLQVRPNVRWITISWHACAVGHEKLKPPCPLTNAMRQAIHRQVLAWKRAQPNKLCNACGSTRSLQVDHNPRPFVELKDTFLCKTHIAQPDRFRFDRRTHGTAFYAGPFVRAWQEHHALNATYQFLCRSCNAKKGCKAVLPNPSIVSLENVSCNLKPNGPCIPTL